MPYAAYHAVKPTSINFTGTSASIVNDSSVTFSAVTSLSLNNIFTSAYKNYIILIRNTSSNSGIQTIYGTLRSSGVNDPQYFLSGSLDYSYQIIYANGTTVSRGGFNDWSWVFGYASNGTYEGRYITIYQPYLTTSTSYRCITTEGYNANLYGTYNGTHDKPSSYDGITITPTSGSITGLISTYGMVE